MPLPLPCQPALSALPVLPAVLATALLLGHGSALAQGQPLASRISAVKLYPGSATVERTARVPAGSRSVLFDCLPAGLDAGSVQVQAAPAAGGAALQVGDIAVQVQPRTLASGCTSALDARVRELEQRLAQARAETGALELAQGYLHSVAGSAPGAPPAASTAAAAAPAPAAPAASRGGAAPAPGQIAATTEALQRVGQDTLGRLYQARARQDELEQQFKALSAERERAFGPQARVASVRIALAAARETELRLSYQVRGPSWSPSYRATLDTASASPSVRLERLALVSQSTGEDWQDAALTLSTGQPLRASAAPLPRPWTVDVRPPMAEPPSALPTPAPAAMARLARPEAAGAAADEAQPDFSVAVAEGAYATEFAVPQRVSVPSGGPRIALALQAQELPASLFSRSTPALDASAYLVAQLAPLPGVWPAGPVALYRDGAYVGQGTLDATSAQAQAQPELSFGRDERIGVSAEPEQQHSASAGLTGARTERSTERSYTFTNRHQRSVQLQVLDAAPVSRDAQVKVESHYEPAPAEAAWRGQPGTIAWSQPLAAGASARFAARHVLRHDKDVLLRERR